MKTSRRDGILILHTNKPYKIAINGKLEERNTIICKDINYKTESIAFDFEQLLTRAIFAMQEKYANNPERLKIEGSANTENDIIDNESFFNNDSPSDEEIMKMAVTFCSSILFSKEVSLKEFLDLFKQLIFAGLIECENQIKMTETIWQTVHRNVKADIVFAYLVFFVNPLQRLSTMFSAMEKKKLN